MLCPREGAAEGAKRIAPPCLVGPRIRGDTASSKVHEAAARESPMPEEYHALMPPCSSSLMGIRMLGSACARCGVFGRKSGSTTLTLPWLHLSQALEMFDAMTAARVQPDRVVYNAVIACCAQLKLWRKGVSEGNASRTAVKGHLFA